jgi:hypothetical protein
MLNVDTHCQWQWECHVLTELENRLRKWRANTVNPVGPVFHLFSLGNPEFIIYMAELRVDEFGMNFQL